MYNNVHSKENPQRTAFILRRTKEPWQGFTDFCSSCILRCDLNNSVKTLRFSCSPLALSCLGECVLDLLLPTAKQSTVCTWVVAERIFQKFGGEGISRSEGLVFKALLCLFLLAFQAFHVQICTVLKWFLFSYTSLGWINGITWWSSLLLTCANNSYKVKVLFLLVSHRSALY